MKIDVTFSENDYRFAPEFGEVVQIGGGDTESAYNDGYAAGQKAEYDRLVDETKIIEKTVSGSAIRVDDVSEIPHKCTVSVDKDATVTVCGKNLFNINAVGTSADVVNNGNGTLTVNTSARAAKPPYNSLQHYAPGLVVGQIYTLSADSTGDNKIIYLSGEYPLIWEFGRPVVMTDEMLHSTVVWYSNSDNTPATINNVQIELGSTATTYEPYISATHTITAGQTIEVDSICPTMTLLADNDATITLNYHKSWGKQAEYDRFWDRVQVNGTRTDYTQAFSVKIFPRDRFDPKYDMRPTNASYMFAYGNPPVAIWFDIDLRKIGVALDLSNCTSVQSMCHSNYQLVAFGTLDLRKITDFNASFYYTTRLHTIEKLILADSGTQSFTNTFSENNALANITVEGVIGRSINLSWSPLTVASMKSIISHLKNYAGTESANTYSVKFSAARWAALEADSAAPDGGTWQGYVHDTLGWNV